MNMKSLYAGVTYQPPPVVVVMLSARTPKGPLRPYLFAYAGRSFGVPGRIYYNRNSDLGLFKLAAKEYRHKIEYCQICKAFLASCTTWIFNHATKRPK